jgi:hypothetical protein
LRDLWLTSGFPAQIEGLPPGGPFAILCPYFILRIQLIYINELVPQLDHAAKRAISFSKQFAKEDFRKQTLFRISNWHIPGSLSSGVF